MKVAVRGGDADDVAAVGVGGATVVDAAAPDVVVAIGDATIRSAVADPPAAPLLPVMPASGRHTATRDTLDAAVAAVVAGDRRVDTHPVLGLRHDGDAVARALRDVTVVTDAPASISEYALAVGDERLGSVRADGIVVATPLGSDGYAAAAGGPVLEADAGVAVVPIAAFSTAVETRVVDPGVPLTCTVEREGAVALVVDGVRHGAVDRGAHLRIDRVGSLDVVTPTGTEKF
ncbi:MAG: ATP-NAD kinase [Haloplanus sp.]